MNIFSVLYNNLINKFKFVLVDYQKWNEINLFDGLTDETKNNMIYHLNEFSR